MTTTVGTQRDLGDLLYALAELDMDAIEAYRAAIARVQDAADKDQLSAFMADHERHVRELGALLEAVARVPPAHADIKAVLTRGKVVLGGLFGDRAILRAMKTNEDDTNHAYERAVAHVHLTAEMREVLARNLADERRHREYIEQRLRTAEQPAAHR